MLRYPEGVDGMESDSHPREESVVAKRNYWFPPKDGLRETLCEEELGFILILQLVR